MYFFTAVSQHFWPCFIVFSCSCFTVFLALFHSIFSLLFHSIFGAVTQYLLLLFLIIIGTVSSFIPALVFVQFYSRPFSSFIPGRITVQLYSRHFQLYSQLGIQLYSFNPGHVTVQHYSRPSLLCYCTALLTDICLLFAGYLSQSIKVICLLFAGCSSPSKQKSFFFCCSAQSNENGATWKPPAVPRTSTLSRASRHMRSHPSTLRTPTPVYTIQVWSYATFIVEAMINRYLVVET